MEPTDSDQFLGRSFGAYRVEALLGEGSSGSVFRATHQQLDRAVALKVLSAPSVSSGAKDTLRFEREAKAAARVQDENVARIFDFGTQHGVSFLAQEFVQGPTLAARLEAEGKLSLAEGFGLGAAVASGLHAIHKAGLVHRDLKPGNIIVPPDGEAKIVDFGLVRILDDGAGITEPGSLLGTPFYMSPEQIGIVRDEIGPAADVFALGCVLSHGLTGKIPHDTGGKSLREFLARRGSDAVPDPRAWRPDLPNDVAEVIQACLERDPASRPTARDVQRVLQAARRALKDVPLPRDVKTQVLGELKVAETPSRADLPAEPVRTPRSRTLALGAGGLVLLLALLIGLRKPPPATESLHEDPPEQSRSVEVQPPPVATPVDRDPLGSALLAIEELRLDDATEALGSVTGATAEVEAAGVLVELLRELNGSSPLSAKRELTREAFPMAPRTLALVESWEPGLGTYARARAAAERRNPLGIMIQFGLFARRGGEGLEAPYLEASRRDEFKLLSVLSGVPRMMRRSPREAHAALGMILASPAGRTPLGQNLEPWLQTLRDRLARRLGR